MQISGFEISEERRWGGETAAGGATALQNDETDGEARRQNGVATTQAKLRRRHELGAFAADDSGVSQTRLRRTWLATTGQRARSGDRRTTEGAATGANGRDYPLLSEGAVLQSL